MACSFSGFGQEQTASFQKKFDNAKHDTTRVVALSDWGFSIYRTKPDSATLLFEKALRITESALNKKPSQQVEEDLILVKGSLINNLAYMYEQLGDIQTALDYNFKSLKIYEETKNEKGEANSLNNIGFIYYKQAEMDKALEFYQKSVKLKEKTNDQQGLAQTLNNIGLLHRSQNNNEKALFYYQKSLGIRQGIGNELGISNSLGNLGFVYSQMGDDEKALSYYLESLRLKEKIKDKQGIPGALNNIGNIYFKRQDYAKALSNINRAMVYANELGYPDLIRKSAGLLYQIHEQQGNAIKALEFYKLHVQMRDSIFNQENRAVAVARDLNYQHEKEKLELQKEQEKKEAIAESEKLALQKEQEKRDALAIADKKRQQIIIYAVSGGLILVVIFALFMFNRFRVTNRQKKVIEDQKLLVEEKNTDITNSINYASRIQKAILTSDEYLNEILPEHFILYQPRDIVSGDFYWAYQTGNKIIWAAADCTGHGVPGAFMSMIGNALLNETVIENGITNTNEILDRLRTGVIKALKHEGSGIEQKDGMDMAICVLDKNTNQLHFSGANNPLWIIRSNEIIEYKGDKQPIGQYETLLPFKQQSIQLQSGDAVYIFSDGFPDQFGGPRGKKYKYSQFKDLLISLQSIPIKSQKSELETAFSKWKGELEQVDDVCIIGVRI
jgi:serine phosphatase RsbU (regulator of sigma subunit)